MSNDIYDIIFQETIFEPLQIRKAERHINEHWRHKYKDLFKDDMASCHISENGFRLACIKLQYKMQRCGVSLETALDICYPLPYNDSGGQSGIKTGPGFLKTQIDYYGRNQNTKLPWVRD